MNLEQLNYIGNGGAGGEDDEADLEQMNIGFTD